MAQTLPCTSIMGEYNVSLKKCTVFEYKTLVNESMIIKFPTSKTPYNSPLLNLSCGLFFSFYSNSKLISQHFSTFNTGRLRKTISAAYSAGIGMSQRRNYNRLGGCLVVSPLPSGKRPRGIIKFLGGAFIGAVPEVFYSLFMDLLAKEGFLVVAVPYNVTFDHAQAAKEVYDKFNSCMDILLALGFSPANLTPNDILELPVYCIGHSNGALLQSLEGSYFEEKLPKVNVLIAFNNKPAAEAVPYFEQVGPTAAQFAPLLAASPFYEMARSTSGDAFRTMLEAAGLILEQYDPEVTLSLTRFTEQIPSVMNQISQGTSEFKPSPSENRETIKTCYKIPMTLLVKFSFDTIDETDRLEEILRPNVDAVGGTLSKVVLNGTHVTPCGQILASTRGGAVHFGLQNTQEEPAIDLNWQVGDLYTPVDALAQGFKGVALNDIRALVKTISQWFDNLS